MFWLLPSGQGNRVKHVSWGLYCLLAANAIVFVLTYFVAQGDGGEAVMSYALPADDWRPYQLFTANFLHADLLHLLGNLLFLWLFGDSIEDALGTVPFLLLYFVGGLLGNLLYVHSNTGDIPSLGASGCVSAIAGAYAVLFYDRSVDVKLMFAVFPLKTFAVRALLVLAFWFGLDLWLAWSTAGHMRDDDSVNYVVHAIGLLCGLFVGMVARLQGVMRRYERLPSGHAWFGYWPDSLERRAGRRFTRRPER